VGPSPLLARRGGRDIKKISRSLVWGADGVVVLDRGFRISSLNHHPVCTFGAATPPVQEGRSAHLRVSSFLQLSYQLNGVDTNSNGVGVPGAGLGDDGNASVIRQNAGSLLKDQRRGFGGMPEMQIRSAK
jgi:hypothetical protein